MCKESRRGRKGGRERKRKRERERERKEGCILTKEEGKRSINCEWLVIN